MHITLRTPRFLLFCMYLFPQIWYEAKKRENLGQHNFPTYMVENDTVLAGESSAKIVVLYLARGESSAEREAIGKFFSTYRKYTAGIDHELVTIIKGFKNESDLSNARAHWSNAPHIELECNDDLFDLGAFTYAAKHVKGNVILVLNTFSRIESNEWLLKIARTYYSTQKIGIVGCSASFGKHRTNSNFKKKGPNPHIRTNGFFMEKELFIQIAGVMNFKSKESTLEFESGDRSLPNQLLKMGYQVLLVGKNGLGYEIDEWPYSRTFALGNQENLLLSDNQTSRYKQSNVLQRVRFTYGAWGEFKAINKQPDLHRRQL